MLGKKVEPRQSDASSMWVGLFARQAVTGFSPT